MPVDSRPAARTLPDVLRRSARLFGRRPALVADDRTLTYAELADCVDRLAVRLAAAGLHPGDRVGLCLERGPLALVASAALMRLSCAYVPLDVGHPTARLRHIVGHADTTAAVCDASGAAALADVPVDTVVVDADCLVPGAVAGPVPPPCRPDAVAYVMYTSGSTGTPKGVPVTHANVTALLQDALPLFGLVPGESWPLQHGHGFDVSVWEIWAGIATGATLVALRGPGTGTAEHLTDAVLRHGCTRLHIVPGVFRHLTEFAEQEDLQLPLRTVVFCGEAVDYPSMSLWERVHEGRGPRWLNVYGITETTVYNTVHAISGDELATAPAATPIGRFYRRSPGLVLDEDLRELPPGEPGELAVGGPQVTPGYLHAPELTAERFVTLEQRTGRWYRTGDRGFRDAAGGFHYVGRRDDQVKVRGFRIELGEIDHAMRALPWVRDAAAVRHGSARGEALLTAFVVTDVDGDDLLVRLRGELAAQLPEHMLPACVQRIPQLPLNVNGKTDRRALASRID